VRNSSGHRVASAGRCGQPVSAASARPPTVTGGSCIASRRTDAAVSCLTTMQPVILSISARLRRSAGGR
jgi:hypothetical protein